MSIEPEVEPRHRKVAVLTTHGPDCNPNDRGVALSWAQTGLTFLQNRYAVEERLARLIATLELHGGEWVACRPPTEFEPEGRDMPNSGTLVLFVLQTERGPIGRMGCWDVTSRRWHDTETDEHGPLDYAPKEVTHWRPYPALPEPEIEPAIESEEVASG